MSRRRGETAAGAPIRPSLRHRPQGRGSNRASPAPGAVGIPRALQAGGAWGWRLLVVGAVAYFVVDWLAGLTVVTVPLALALLLAALLHRPTLALRRWLPRWLAGTVVVLLALAVAAAVAELLVWRVQGQTGRLADETQDAADSVRNWVSELPGVSSGSASLLDRATAWLQEHESTLLDGAVTAGTVALQLLIGVVLTVFLTLFFLIDGDRMWAWCVRLLPARHRPAANGAGHRAFATLSGWVTGTAIIALVHGVVIGVTMWLLGTPLVFVLAVLVFIGSFLPVVGAFVFGGLACLVTLAAQGWGAALVLLIVTLVSNLLEGHLYQPLIMGRAVQLHPVTVLLGITIGSELDGLAGAVFVIPLAAAVHAAVKYLTGIEDIDGHPLRDEDRMAPELPPRTARSPVGPP